MAETTRRYAAPDEREGDVHWYDLPDDEAEEFSPVVLEGEEAVSR
ncbi:hypothetical protein AB0M50_34225 [Nonomuraea fuscirosea]|jgi:hypothetical protein|nr:hypothetical protein [Nonomuraea fuscirosea]WSA48986.1 hypothetical protein OIE67_33515 [Nonomuraea fuscirosea]